MTWCVSGICERLFAFSLIRLQPLSSGHCMMLSSEALHHALHREPSADGEGQWARHF